MVLTRKINVLLVDDRDIIRDLIKLMFMNDHYISITGEAEDGLEALELVKKNNYDVVIIDINMPNLNGIKTTADIKKIKPDLKILANSFYQNIKYIEQVLIAGASGYIVKGETAEEYREAISIIFNGGVYFTDQIDEVIYEKVFKRLKNPVLI